MANTVPNKNALLLLSGGLDSSACLCFLKSNSFIVSALFIDYKQPAANSEEQAARTIARHYDVQFNKVEVTGIEIPEKGFVLGRNAFLYSTALMTVTYSAGVIVSGIHSGTSYSDCTPSFLEKVQGLYDIYSNSTVQVYAPFIDWNKKEIWEYSRINQVPTGLTYSCESGDTPCGKCLSCIDMKLLYAGENK